MSPPPRLDSFLADLLAEFPDFRILPKRGDRLQHAISLALALVTLGGQRRYMTHYHTVLFGKLYVPDAWSHMDESEKYILLRHERVHLRQRRRLGDLTMGLCYLVPFFPLFLAWGRARIEWEAYVETIRATAEVRGLDAARRLREEIVRRFTGPDYGWMWPFPRAVRGWFDDVIAGLEHDAAHDGGRNGV